LQVSVIEQDGFREVARIEARLEPLEARPRRAVLDLAGLEERRERLVTHVGHPQTVLDRRGRRSTECRQRERG